MRSSLRGGPEGPRTRYNILTVCNLEYEDYSPNHKRYKGQPRKQPEPWRYLEWEGPPRDNPLYDKIKCCAWRAEIGRPTEKNPHGLHHDQVFLWLDMPNPSKTDIKLLFSNLKKWQLHIGDEDGKLGLDNPYGGYLYCIKDETYRDSKGRPDTGRPMPGSVPHVIGSPPPKGVIRKGNLPGTGRPKGAGAGGGPVRGGRGTSKPAEIPGLDFVTACLENAKKNVCDFLKTPIIANGIKPSLQLALLCKAEGDQPDTSFNPNRWRQIFPICGPAGIGKTTGVKRWCEEHGLRLALGMRVDGMYGKWMQRYDNHDAVLFDDFTGNMDFWLYLTLTHDEEELVNVKGRDAVWRPRYVFFTTNATDPENEWRWPFGEQRGRSIMYDKTIHNEPFRRRFDHGGILNWTQPALDAVDKHVGQPMPFPPNQRKAGSTPWQPKVLWKPLGPEDIVEDHPNVESAMSGRPPPPRAAPPPAAAPPRVDSFDPLEVPELPMPPTPISSLGSNNDIQAALERHLDKVLGDGDNSNLSAATSGSGGSGNEPFEFEFPEGLFSHDSPLSPVINSLRDEEFHERLRHAQEASPQQEPLLSEPATPQLAAQDLAADQREQTPFFREFVQLEPELSGSDHDE